MKCPNCGRTDYNRAHWVTGNMFEPGYYRCLSKAYSRYFQIVGGVCLVFCILGLFALLGCDQLREQPAPQKPVDIPHVQFHGDMPTDRIVEVITETDHGGSTEKANSQGAGMTATGDKAQANIDASAPAVSLTDGGGATGGDTIGRAFGQTDSKKVQLFCIGIGAMGILAGLWLTSKGNKHGLAIAGAGGGLVAAGLMPAWFWPIAGFCALAAGIYWFWTSKLAADRKPESETLGIVLSAIDSSPDGVRSTVKQIVDKKADERHKNVIRKLTK